MWDWDTKKLRQTLDLGADGLIPLELRFKHDPDSADGFVGAALSSNVLHIHKVRVLRHVVASSFKTDVLGVDLVELILSPLH